METLHQINELLFIGSKRPDDPTENTTEITDYEDFVRLRRNQTSLNPAFIVLDHFNQMTNSNYSKERGKTKTTLDLHPRAVSEDYSPEDLMLVGWIT